MKYSKTFGQASFLPFLPPRPAPAALRFLFAAARLKGFLKKISEKLRVADFSCG